MKTENMKFTKTIFSTAIAVSALTISSLCMAAGSYDADQVTNSGQIVLQKGAVLNADSIAGTEGSGISNVKGGAINLTGSGSSNLGDVANNGTISVKNGSATAKSISGDANGRKGQVNVGSNESPAEFHVSGPSELGTTNIRQNSSMTFSGGSTSKVINNRGTLRVVDGARLELNRINGDGGTIENGGVLDINSASKLGTVDNAGILIISGEGNAAKVVKGSRKAEKAGSHYKTASKKKATKTKSAKNWKEEHKNLAVKSEKKTAKTVKEPAAKKDTKKAEPKSRKSHGKIRARKSAGAVTPAQTVAPAVQPAAEAASQQPAQ